MGGYFAQTRFSVKKKCELKALVVNVATVLYLIRSVDPGLRQVYKKCLLKKKKFSDRIREKEIGEMHHNEIIRLLQQEFGND